MDSIRHQLAILVRRKGSRIVQWTPEVPSEWQPRSVLNPETGEPFTADAAWEFLGNRLDDVFLAINEVELTHPPGRKAYDFTIAMPDGRRLYVKLQLLNGKVSGRSFHYSKK